MPSMTWRITSLQASLTMTRSIAGSTSKRTMNNYNMDKKSSVNKVKKVAKVIVNSLFADFIAHPEYKGPNFTWDNFPNMAEKIVRANLFTSFSEREYKKEWEELAGEVAFQHAKSLVAQKEK